MDHAADESSDDERTASISGASENDGGMDIDVQHQPSSVSPVLENLGDYWSACKLLNLL